MTSLNSTTMEYELTASEIVLLVRTLILLIAPLTFLFFKIRKDPRIAKVLSKYNGPVSIPFFGTFYTVFTMGGREGIFNTICYKYIHDYGRLQRMWLGNFPMVVIASAKNAERVLHSAKHITKSQNYEIIRPLGGNGLVTLNDHVLWRAHKKILTPAFHFDILQEFLLVFNKHANILSNKLKTISAGGTSFNIFNPITLCALDIINESSMGATIDAQNDENSPFVTAIRNLDDYFVQRYFSLFLRVPLFYRFSSLKRNIDKAVKIISDFTEPVIEQRRQYWQSVKKCEDQSSGRDDVERKTKNFVFIDVILMAEENERQFYKDSDIRDEVITFMLAGHDTVATTMGWALFLIGTYPEVQEKVVEELVQVFGDTGREPTSSDLSELKYLERCIKETLRLYPSIPFFERHILEDIQLDCGRVIPAGCNVSFIAYAMHRDPEYFPDPEKFDPDRFLPENTKQRHPYAYIPFSAGPRNCIGQKYALLEAKSLLSTILRRFKVEATQSRSEVKLEAAAVLKPRGGLNLRMLERENLPQLQVMA